MYESLVMVYKITERRQGAIYKTALLGPAWVPMGADAPEGYVHASPSDSEIKKHGAGGWSAIRKSYKEATL